MAGSLTFGCRNRSRLLAANVTYLTGNALQPSSQLLCWAKARRGNTLQLSELHQLVAVALELVANGGPTFMVKVQGDAAPGYAACYRTESWLREQLS